MARFYKAASLVIVHASLASGRSAYGSANEVQNQQLSHSAGPSIYESVSSKVSALEAQLSEVELENTHVLEKQKRSYDDELKVRQDANAALAVANEKLKEDIDKLRSQSKDLEGQARSLQKENSLFVKDLATLKSNLSTVLEYTDGSLKELGKSGSKQLLVLDELSNLEANHMAKNTRASRFQEIASGDVFSGMALLQTGKSPQPGDLLKVLDAGFQDLAEEHSRRKAKLKSEYKKLFQAQAEKHSDLTETQKALIAEQRQLTKLVAKLTDAVAFLREEHKELEKRSSSVRSYAQRLGIRGMPGQRSSSEDSLRRAAAAPGNSVAKPHDFDEEQIEADVEQNVAQSALRQPARDGSDAAAMRLAPGSASRALLSWFR